MHVQQTKKSDSEVTLRISASAIELEPIKASALRKLSSHVKLAGFRAGKAPLNLVEKSLDQQLLQSEFLDQAINQLYGAALREQKLRPVASPQVNLKKFVPFTEVEFEAQLEVLGSIKLPDYKKIKKSKKAVTVTEEDVDGVLATLQKRAAATKEVTRAAIKGDGVVIDFSGKDVHGKVIRGAESKDYPLELGSNMFIPGFEEQLIGLKAGAEKTFTLTFPKDYRPSTLAGKKVTFSVQVKKVHELTLPKLDDVFAAKVSPFQSLAELKVDIKKQVANERQQETDRAFEGELVQEITGKVTLNVPKTLVDEQVESMLRELKQNLAYRGQTFPEFLELEGKTEEQYKKEILISQAEARVKAGLVLAEIAEAEKLEVTPEELEIRMQLLQDQYKDAQMQAELAKPEARLDIASRLLTEKTLARLTRYATA